MALQTASRGAGLVFFCNPNNPVGTAVNGADTRAYLSTLLKQSPNTTVLVDEAYFEYATMPGYETTIPLAVENPRVVVARTFSKCFGMAGLRIGYAIGHKDTIAALKLTTTSGRLPVTSVAAALAVIEDQALIKEGVRANGEARAAITKSLRDLGLSVLHSDTNFILVDVRQKPEEFQAACKKSNVIVGRPFPGLPTHARISIGSLEEMQGAVAVFKAVLTRT